MNPTAILPAELRHLAPLDDETIFVLGVISLMGKEIHDFLYPSYLQTLAQQNPNDLKPWLPRSQIDTNYPHLINRHILDKWDLITNQNIYVPRYDQDGFLRCLTFEQKSKVFTATVLMLRQFFPEWRAEDSTYLLWRTCRESAGHVKSLAMHWDAFDESTQTLQVPLVFVTLLWHCAGYMHEINDRRNAILLSEIGLKILRRLDFSSEHSNQTLDLLKARFLSIKGSVSIQLLDNTTAREALETAFRLHKSCYPVGNNLEVLASQGRLALLAAAEGQHFQSMSLGCMVWEVLKSAHFNDNNQDARRRLQMHIANIAGRSAILIGKYNEAQNMLDDAAALFNQTVDNPTYRRAVEHALGNLYYAQGNMDGARRYYLNCTLPAFGPVMEAKQTDEERTVSIYRKLAMMDVQENKPKVARSKVQNGLQMLNTSHSPYAVALRGRLQLIWATILRQFPGFAKCCAREEEDHPKEHEDAAQQAAAELGISTDGLVDDEQFVSHLPWDLR